MEQRRFFLFFVLSMAIGLTWINFVVPMIIPGFNRPPKPIAKPELDHSAAKDDSPADALRAVNATPDHVAVPAKIGAAIPPQHPIQTVMLGPTDPDDGRETPIHDKSDEFLIAASLSSQGAAIDYVELTDKKRYPAFGHRGHRVRVVGNEATTPIKTFALSIPEIDKQLGKTSLDRVSWEVVPGTDPASEHRVATFRFVSPDGRWELTKQYELNQLTHEQMKKPDYRDTLVAGYEIKLKITAKNLSNQPQKLTYTLQGPVGVPLEDKENSYKYREVRMGWMGDGATVDGAKVSASEVAKKAKNNKTEVWTRKVKYIGVDVLYFAALVIPENDQVESTKAVLSNENIAKPEFSDVSVELTSMALTVPSKDSISHEYTLFAGPKRKEMIGQLSAISIMDYGWFDSICRGMVWLLNSFHHFGLSYGIAIICLTALVRTLLMPISKHQAANAEKMKVLQPKIQARQKELEAKYGKNTEEYMKAAQELSKEQLGLMMSGCLPVFLQLPIFIALYRAIGSSIELRMEPFLWFENLASPDALFKLPFTVPWFGWTDFNLLPCISTGLMFIHQKRTMPAPTNEEQAQQQKMMSYMMIFMGAMFFRVPSGLCLYFIATNIWSMTERYIFQHFKRTPPPEQEIAFVNASSSPSSPPSTSRADDEKPSKLGGIWNRLQEAADTHHSATRQLDNTNSARDEKKKKKR